MKGGTFFVAETLYTVKEVASILRTNVNYVYKLMNTGLLKYLVIGQKKVRESTLNEFIRTYEGYDISDLDNIKEVGTNVNN